MRTVLILLAMTLSLGAMEIAFEKTFTKEVEPKLIRTNLLIKAQGESEKRVSSILQETSVFIDGYSQVQKSGGNLKIMPRYSHEEDKKELKGFEGMLSYEIQSDNFDHIEVFLQDLLSHKDKETITVQNLGYVLSKDQKEDELEKLRFKAILWGISYAKSLSSKIYEQCSVDEISFKRPKAPVMFQTRMSEQDQSRKLTRDFIPNPVKKPRSLSMQPSFLLKCIDDR